MDLPKKPEQVGTTIDFQAKQKSLSWCALWLEIAAPVIAYTTFRIIFHMGGGDVPYADGLGVIGAAIQAVILSLIIYGVLAIVGIIMAWKAIYIAKKNNTSAKMAYVAIIIPCAIFTYFVIGYFIEYIRIYNSANAWKR